MSARSKMLVEMVVKNGDAADRNYDLEELRCPLDLNEDKLEEQCLSSDLDEGQEIEAEHLKQNIGDIFSEDEIPESDQESSQIKLIPPRRVSETSSSESLFGGDFSDNDPSYYPEEKQRPPSSLSSEESLVTLQDLLDANTTENIPPLPMTPQPFTSQQYEQANGKTSFEISSLILMDILELVWDQVKSLNRWRTPNPNNWKKNVAIKRRADGLPYCTKNQKRAPKIPKAVDCTKCLFKCTSIFTEEDREKICRMYWHLDFIGKKNFILSRVTVQPLKKVVVNRKRAARPFSTKCFLDVGADKRQVCQKFLCSTLAISNAVLNNAIKNRDELGFYAGVDTRGHRIPPNKTPPEKMQEVIDHINSFPSMEGHYVRKQSKRMYLDRALSINKMYQLYLQKYENPVSQITYRRIFSTQFNLSFFVPKKDQCQVCNKYALAEGETKLSLEKSYAEHIERKRVCETEKEKDKQRAGCDNTFMSVSFDLQSILQIPSSKIGLLYYVRKLTVYNLTIYESALPNNAFCFTWSEVHGKKGSAEIGTIIYHYLSNCIPKNVTRVTLFSDTAGGQNRNQNIAAILLWTVNKIEHLQEIEQKFLESGHSYMEADSMHSSIENVKKNRDVYSMTDWKNIFKSARSKGIYKVGNKKVKKDPYNVKEFKHNEFFDLKQLADTLLKNKKIDNNGERVQWLKMKKIKYVKGDTKIYFNYDVSDNYLNFDVRGMPVARKNSTPQSGSRYSTRMGKRQEKQDNQSPDDGGLDFPDLLQLYANPLAISAAKKKDLINLCKKGVIPEEYHGWFHSLSSNSNLIDRVPDVAVSETSEEEE